MMNWVHGYGKIVRKGGERMRIFKKALIDSIPVMMGYLVVGIAYGIFASDAGISALETVAMDFVIFAGSMQFVTVRLLNHAPAFITVALLTLLVNFRHLFYGLPLIKEYKEAKGVKAYLIYALTDETFALTQQKLNLEKKDKIKYYFFITLLDQSYWVLGSILGIVLFRYIPFSTNGVEFAMTALFSVLFLEAMREKKVRFDGYVALGLCVASLLLFPKQYFVIIALIAISLYIVVWKGGKLHE
jgi:4-azaleucine resistance transporter AzlC